MSQARYEFTGESKVVDGITVRRIRALVNFQTHHIAVAAGTVGGWIEDAINLPAYGGNSWVHDEAIVFGNAAVLDNATVRDYAIVGEYAMVRDCSQVRGSATIGGHCNLLDNSLVRDQARLYGNVKMVGAARVSDRAIVSGDSYLCENTRIGGDAVVVGSRVRHQASVAGNASVQHSQVLDRSSVSGDARLEFATLRDDAIASGTAQIDNVVVCNSMEIDMGIARDYTPVNVRGLRYDITITDNHLSAGCQTHTFDQWRKFTQAEIRSMDGQHAMDFIGPMLAIMEGVLAVRAKRTPRS